MKPGRIHAFLPESAHGLRWSVALFLLSTTGAIGAAGCMPADRVSREESPRDENSPASRASTTKPAKARTKAPRQLGTQIDGRPPFLVDVVDHVVDGDTIVGERVGPVRLIGINTPELHGSRSGVACYGREAAERLRELLPEGTTIELRLDIEDRDRYDRLLAYVYRQGDGAFVNAKLVEEGYAMVATIPPNVAHVNRLLDIQTAARTAKRGLWTRCLSSDEGVP